MQQNPHPYYNSPQPHNPNLNLHQVPGNWPANVRVKRITKQDQWGNIFQEVVEDFNVPQLPQHQAQMPSSQRGGTKFFLIGFLLLPLVPGLLLLAFALKTLVEALVVVVLGLFLVVFIIRKTAGGLKKLQGMPRRSLPQPQGYHSPTAPLPLPLPSSISQIPTSNFGSGHPTTGLMPSVSYPQPTYPQSNNPHP